MATLSYVTPVICLGHNGNPVLFRPCLIPIVLLVPLIKAQSSYIIASGSNI